MIGDPRASLELLPQEVDPVVYKWHQRGIVPLIRAGATENKALRGSKNDAQARF